MRAQVHTMFAHFRDSVLSRGGSRWWNTNFAENAHIGACKTTYNAGNKQVATIQPQMAANFERRRVMHKAALELGVQQEHVRAHAQHTASAPGLPVERAPPRARL
jgi:hypothetical protein